jgi:Mrp family chromosome partitioning ATPase
MGEIADALRRTRGVLFPSPSEGPATPPAPAVPAGDIPPMTPSPRAARRALPPGRHVDTLEPTRSAILLRDAPGVEACRHLAVRLLAEIERRNAGVVAVVSAMRGEGKTTVACDLALALASVSGARGVALLDLDLRNPSVARYLGLAIDIGVETLFTSDAALDDVRVEVDHPDLDIFPALRPSRDAHELLVLPALARLIGELRRRYGVVIVDTPPALIVPDASLILREVPVCVAVARSGVTRARLFKELVRGLPRDRLIGEILNGARGASHVYGSYHYAPTEDDTASGGSTARGLRRGAGSA